jgi:YHS domain-containing protein
MLASRLLLGSLVIGLAVGLTGCSNKEDIQKGKSTPQTIPTKEASATATTEELSGLAELSAEDRELAIKQRICPVSGDALDAMGKPFKTLVNGKTVFLCCSGCEADLKADPEKYLAKLKDMEEKK